MVEAAGVELITVLITRKLFQELPKRLKRPHCPIHCTFIVRKRFSLGTTEACAKLTRSHKYGSMAHEDYVRNSRCHLSSRQDGGGRARDSFSSARLGGAVGQATRPWR